MHEQDKSGPFQQYDNVCVQLFHYVDVRVDKRTSSVCHGIQEFFEKL